MILIILNILIKDKNKHHRVSSQKLDRLDVLIKALVESEATIVVCVDIEEAKLEAVAYCDCYQEPIVLVGHPVKNRSANQRGGGHYRK